MITLYLARHCETVWNAEKRMQGWNDSAPNTCGLSQSAALADRLSSIRIDHIISSPTGRAYFTAETTALPHNLPVIKDDRLREINLGRWEGMLESQIRTEDPDCYYNFWKNPADYLADGGENFSDVSARMQSFLDSIKKGPEGETILALSHTVAIRTLCIFLTGRPVSELWFNPVIAPTALTEIRIEDGHAQLVSFADSSHLLSHR
jgi:probable phosphoglycerate mutase